jgi:hypothetical protein
MATHPCPGGCTIRVPDGLFACADCWYRLPPPLRGAIIIEYRKRARRDAYKQACGAARAWYTEAAAARERYRHIQPGDPVMCRTASNEWLPKVAVSGVETDRHDFPVVMVRADLHDVEAVPWPAEDVRVVE